MDRVGTRHPRASAWICGESCFTARPGCLWKYPEPFVLRAAEKRSAADARRCTQILQCCWQIRNPIKGRQKSLRDTTVWATGNSEKGKVTEFSECQILFFLRPLWLYLFLWPLCSNTFFAAGRTGLA